MGRRHVWAWGGDMRGAWGGGMCGHGEEACVWGVGRRHVCGAWGGGMCVGHGEEGCVWGMGRRDVCGVPVLMWSPYTG